MTYVLGHRSPSGKKAQMGTIVHKVMECLSRAKKALQENKLSFTDDSLGRVRFTESSLFTDKFVDKMLAKSYDHYTSDCIHHYTKGDKNNCRKWVWMGLEYNDGQFDPRNRKIIETEPQFDIEIEDPWAKYNYDTGETPLSGKLRLKGTIDLITESGDGVIEVIDWKTGRRVDWATGEEKDYDKLSNDPQLLLYYYAISKMFPEYDQSIMTIFYIKDGGPFSLCFDKNDEEKFLAMLRKRFNQIKNNTRPCMLSNDQSHWKCKNLCHFYKTNWNGTDTNMCRYVHDKIKKEGIDVATSECTKDGFSLGYYESPG